jgi:hypothetical protein
MAGMKVLRLCLNLEGQHSAPHYYICCGFFINAFNHVEEFPSMSGVVVCHFFIAVVLFFPVSDKCSYSFGFYSTNIINFTG